jgi:tRNA-2-methylthio-N6-dimethylallyladenosine synthase
MIQNRICGEINAMMIGSHIPILVEGPSKKDPSKMTGRTRTNKVVNVPGSTALIGRTVTVRITRAKPFDLEGECIP